MNLVLHTKTDSHNLFRIPLLFKLSFQKAKRLMKIQLYAQMVPMACDAYPTLN